MNESMNHQQQKPHGDASIDNRKSLMVMMNQWEEKKEPHGNESIHNPPKKFNHPWWWMKDLIPMTSIVINQSQESGSNMMLLLLCVTCVCAKKVPKSFT